jgi:hypothetical protein
MSNQPLHYFPDKKRLLFATLAFLAFAAFFVVLLLSPKVEPQESWFMTLCAVVCTGFVLIGASVLLSRGPMLTITDSGLSWNAGLSQGTLRWDEITSAECVDYRGSSWVRVGVRNESEFIARLSPWRRVLVNGLKRIDWPITATCIPGSGLKGITARGIEKHVRRHLSGT